MTLSSSDSVVIRNVFYMLAYATGTMGGDARTLITSHPSLMSKEDFEDISSLFADVLISAVYAQRSRGFDSTYHLLEEDMQSVKGRIGLNRSLQLKARGSMRLSCSYDEFSIDTYMNRIIKTALVYILKRAPLASAKRKQLREVTALLADVKTLPKGSIDWHFIRYTRQNSSYRFLMSICRIILEHSIPLDDDYSGDPLPSLFTEQRLSSLFEGFVREYYRKHYKPLNSRATIIKSGIEKPSKLLPALKTDIVLDGLSARLIIDTKCYGRILKTNCEKQILAPAHRNQILSYVLHEAARSKSVEGMLLYAETTLDGPINESWKELGHVFNARSLNLNVPFEQLAQQLDLIGDALLAGTSPAEVC